MEERFWKDGRGTNAVMIALSCGCQGLGDSCGSWRAILSAGTHAVYENDLCGLV